MLYIFNLPIIVFIHFFEIFPNYYFVAFIKKFDSPSLSTSTYFEGYEVTEEQLEEVAELSEVLASNDDYLSAEFRNKCEQVIPDPLEIDVSDFAHAFRYLKENVHIHT